MPLFSDPQTLLESLNGEQKEAVETTDGPLLIIAGAGTGKTSVVTRRIAYILNKGLAKPEEILALTFTDKACEEMRTRLDELLPYGLSGSDIFTFHSFGEMIIRENALDLNISPDYTLMTKAEEIYFFRQHIFLLPLSYYRPLGNPTKFVEQLISYFSKLQDEDIKDFEYEKYLLDLEKQLSRSDEGEQEVIKELLVIHNELYACFKAYEEAKLKEGFLNFADLITLSLDAIRNHPTIREYYQNKYKYILVDEFQDTNYTQNEIVKLISSKHKNICVCGDDDQSIYRFRGASISNIMTFMTDYPNAKQVVLTKNYRSNQAILDSAYSLITKNNPDRLEVASGINKQLIASGNAKDFPVVSLGLRNVSDELEYISNTIEQIKEDDKSLKYKDIAILIRSNSQSESILREFFLRNIPAIFQGTSGLYETKEIRPIISFLYSLARFEDSINLFNLASGHFYNLQMKYLIACNSAARSYHKPLSYVFAHITEPDIIDIDIPEEEKEKISQINKDLDTYREMSKDQNIGSVILEFLKEKGYTQLLGDTQTNERIENIQKFFQRIDRFIQNNKGSTIEQFCEYLDYTREIGDDPLIDETDNEVDAVNILTIHKAKGLEYKVVFMIDLIDGRFPSRNQKDPIELPIQLIKETLPSGNFHLQEERRLFYVGITRAKERLYLLWAQDYFQKTKKKPSIFIKETGNDSKIIEKSEPINEIPRNEQIDNSSPVISKNTRKDIIVLSQSSIEDYITCPRKYDYKHNLKIATPPNAQASYGSLVHSIIQQILKRRVIGESITLDEIDSMLLTQWNNTAFLSDNHSDLLFKTAKDSLYKFTKTFSKDIQAIEKKFSIQIDPNLYLEGRWDLLTKEGEIVDFKTAQVDSEKEAIKKAKESDQLKIYALAYFKTFHNLPKILTLHFISGIEGSIKPNDKMLENATKLIREVGEGLRNGNLKANPSYMACEYCPFNKICEYTLAN